MPAGSTYTPIATTTLGSATGSIAFNSIPSTYTDLRLVFFNQETGTAGNSRYIQFNGDTTAAYSRTKLVGTGSSAYSARQTSQTTLRIAEGGTSAAPEWQLQTIDIMSYSNSTYKTCLIRSNEAGTSAGNVAAIVGLWSNTAAINSITIALFAGTFSIGTTATLYGIQAA